MCLYQHHTADTMLWLLIKAKGLSVGTEIRRIDHSQGNAIIFDRNKNEAVRNRSTMDCNVV